MEDAAAAVNLVGSVLRLVPAVKNATRNVSFGNARGLSGATTAVTPTGGAAVHPAPPRTDPERERRAYETVNYVLRTLGSRIGEAGLVSPPALARALTEATMSIDVKLFSIETNRLFESLASKLNDPLLVNSVFTSIYLICFLAAELQGSLPNYKDTYTPLSPRLIQQLFLAAIGQDAFRENQTANLDAYQTLARTAGLLRPTDLERATFPGFPSFRPCRYSSKSFKDTRNNRIAYEKLVKHFDTYGFPQPMEGRDVGVIRDWRFLSGDSNTRAFEVEKADKHIGENFGRVLHWLVCSAERMPPGEAVVAYLDQHIELIKWMGPRMGYHVLDAATDLQMGGPHAMLKKDLREVFNTWVVLMGSETARAARRASSAQWLQRRPTMESMTKAPATAFQPVTMKPPVSTPPSVQRTSLSSDHVPTLSETNTVPSPRLARATTAPTGASAPTLLQPQPILQQGLRGLALAHMTTASPDALVSPVNYLAQPPSGNPAVSSPTSISPATWDAKPPLPQEVLPTMISPPPYTPPTTTPPVTFPTGRPASVVRRKAPPRPKKKLVFAKALDDFEPEDENNEELPFKEGDILEIVEKSATLEEEGWCRARLKDSKRVGLVPLEYLEEMSPEASQALQTQPLSPSTTSSTLASLPLGLGTVTEVSAEGSNSTATHKPPDIAEIHELPSNLARSPITGSPEAATTNMAQQSTGNISPFDSLQSHQHQLPSMPSQTPQHQPNVPVPGFGHHNTSGSENVSFPLTSPASSLPTSSSTVTQHIVPSNGSISNTAGAIAHGVASYANSHHNAGHPGNFPLGATQPIHAPFATHHHNTQQSIAPALHGSPHLGHVPPPLHHMNLPHSQPHHQSPTRPPVHQASSYSSSHSNANAYSHFSGAPLNAPSQPSNAFNPAMNSTINSQYQANPQNTGIPFGPPIQQYGPAYSPAMPMSGYSMSQPVLYTPQQNNSNDDTMLQMLALQGLSQPSSTTAPTYVVPSTSDPSNYTDQLGNQTLSGPSNTGLTQHAVDDNNGNTDTSNTDPTTDLSSDSNTTQTLDPNATTSLPTPDPGTFPLSPSMPDISGQSATQPPDLTTLSINSPTPDPSTLVISNPAADVAAVDPFFAANSPDLASPFLAVDPSTSMASPLACLNPTAATSADPSATSIASVAAGSGSDPTLSPLASLSPQPDVDMTSPLAGLMPDPNTTAALTDPSSTDATTVDDVAIEQTTMVETDTTTVYDDGAGNTFVDDQVDYVMDATACSEEWDA